MADAAQLSPLIVSPGDLKRMRRELETLDDFMHQAGLRQGGKTVSLPNISKALEELASENKLNMLKKTDRDRLSKFISLLLSKAPVLHISFASDPSAKFMNKLVAWLRGNIHPQVVVNIGLQPSITAGCVVRTANNQYDFSMRESFEKQRDLLISTLQEVSEEDKKPQPVPSVAAQLVGVGITPDTAKETKASKQPAAVKTGTKIEVTEEPKSDAKGPAA
jgi:hypothetical protein